MLETVSTAFHGLDVGDGTVEGKYFNKIAEDLRRYQKGTTLSQVLGWITALHGYLSSPTGGGVRHGVDLRSGISVQPNPTSTVLRKTVAKIRGTAGGAIGCTVLWC